MCVSLCMRVFKVSMAVRFRCVLPSVRFKAGTKTKYANVTLQPEANVHSHSKDTLSLSHSKDTHSLSHRKDTHSQSHSKDTHSHSHSKHTHSHSHSKDARSHSHSKDTRTHSHSIDFLALKKRGIEHSFTQIEAALLTESLFLPAHLSSPPGVFHILMLHHRTGHTGPRRPPLSFLPLSLFRSAFTTDEQAPH